MRNNMLPSVSIITLSQFDRIECLNVLKDLILEQTFVECIKEWVIIDGSKVFCSEMESRVRALQTSMGNILIVFVPHEEGARIGKLRNKANNAATSNLLVCMDDDDYYPPERVEEVVVKLGGSSDKLIAGASPSFMYDYILDKQYQFSSFGVNHSPNNSMAFKREYLIDHKHDETVTHAEETSFTNKWTEPMVQLDPSRTVNISSHGFNTFNKRQLLVAHYNGLYPKVSEVPQRMVPDKYYERMRACFVKTSASVFDIVYFCGESISWLPTDENLGGSEQAVKYMTAEWHKMGKKVAVYCNVKQAGIYRGVHYFNWRVFPYHEQFEVVVVWRLMGLQGLFFAQLKAKELWWDLHDNLKYTKNAVKLYNQFKKNNRSFDRIYFKSIYHRTEFESIHPKVAEAKIVPNGLRVGEILSNLPKKEEKCLYRFCYCSSYSRGLLPLLVYLWPEVVKIEPRAELHLYYGDVHETPEFKKQFRDILSRSKNVMDHGRGNLSDIVREKYLSSFQLYLTNSVAEVDCINIREGLLCGCIPIISDVGVFKERDGLKMTLVSSRQATPKTEPNAIEKDLKEAGIKIGNMLKKCSPEQIQKMREALAKSPWILDWKHVAQMWLTGVDYVRPCISIAVR